MFNFSNEQIERYSRHIILTEVGGLGQTKLLESKILVIGAGGLGSPTALYLAAAGVGTLGIIDHDTVDVSNLQRQILHGTGDVGQPKVVSAKATLNEINPDVEIVMYQQRLSSENVFQLFEDYDLVIDGCDNFPTRYLINDACVMMGKPNIHGSIFQFEGQVTIFYPGKGPCYRCLYPSPPPPGMAPSCQEAGVFGVLPGIVGSVQAVEAIKVLLEIGDPLIGQLLLFDALGMSFKRMRLHQDSECPICGANPTIHELIDYEEFCQVNW
ncbi:MAG: adenylyltransferase [Planctomycetes bacterium]|nr:adenylyltransferase [Planctomycetota bacterium]